MISLSSDTSTLLGSVAIHKNGQLLSEKSLMRQGSHSDSLNLLIEQTLQESGLTLNDIDVFATGLGPGSFTGIRISFNTAKTFAYTYQKPFAGIDSLKILAFQNQHLASEICCAINAFKNMVYIATYKVQNGSLIAVKPAQVVRVQQLDHFIEGPVLFVGDAFLAYQDYLSKNLNQKIIRNDLATDYPTANSLGKIVSLENKFFTWSELLPLYLRASEAEENLSGIKYQPL